MNAGNPEPVPSSSRLKVETSPQGVLRVTINRPEKRNALSRAVLAEIKATFKAHAADDTLKTAVLRGSGDKSFAAGGDLRDLEALRTLEDAAGFADDTKAAFDAIRRFPVPVVAAINGDALGGGAELSVACDMRVMASHARLGFIQGRLNIATAWGGGIDLMRLVGPAVGLRLLAGSEMMDAGRVLALGLANAAAEKGQPIDAAVDQFISPFLNQAPQVMRAFKAVALADRLGLSRSEREAIETEHFARTWVHDDHWQAAKQVLGGNNGK